MSNEKIWDIDERTFQFAVRVINMTRTLPNKEIATWVIGKQVIRSATSINSNIVHANSGISRKDFANHLKIALKEARETKRWLEMIVAIKLITENQMKLLIKESDEIISILVTSVIKVNKNS